jgi:hypothetical protein
VEAHAHSNVGLPRPLRLGEGALRGARRANRLARIPKHREERVPLPVDVEAAVVGEGLLEERLVPAEQLGVPLVAERLQQLRRPLDVADEEGERAREQLARG